MRKGIYVLQLVLPVLFACNQTTITEPEDTQSEKAQVEPDLSDVDQFRIAQTKGLHQVSVEIDNNKEEVVILVSKLGISDNGEFQTERCRSQWSLFSNQKEPFNCTIADTINNASGIHWTLDHKDRLVGYDFDKVIPDQLKHSTKRSNQINGFLESSNLYYSNGELVFEEEFHAPYYFHNVNLASSHISELPEILKGYSSNLTPLDIPKEIVELIPDGFLFSEGALGYGLLIQKYSTQKYQFSNDAIVRTRSFTEVKLDTVHNLRSLIDNNYAFKLDNGSNNYLLLNSSEGDTVGNLTSSDTNTLPYNSIWYLDTLHDEPAIIFYDQFEQVFEEAFYSGPLAIIEAKPGELLIKKRSKLATQGVSFEEEVFQTYLNEDAANELLAAIEQAILTYIESY